MEIIAKLAILSDAAKYDVSCSSSGADRKQAAKGKGIGSTGGTGICHSYTPDGRCISLLKILLTNFCVYECSYCINRSSSSVERARFSVEEVVRLTMDFYRRNYVEGLFLSSGIIQSADYTMEQLIAVARSLREDHGFNGYIHLKTIPEASADLIREAGTYADRLSINIELPSQAGLDRFAPEKNLIRTQAAMSDVSRIRSEIKAENKDRSRLAGTRRARQKVFVPAGQSTQMIVGADGSSDGDILSTTASLYSVQKLKRVFYSAYSPIPSASSDLPPVQPPLQRENRLYQADWLIRFYGFGAGELVTPAKPMLDLDIDPKLAWALANRDSFPVNLNTAPKRALLRVPGIGVRSVQRLLSARRFRKIRLQDLRSLRLQLDKVSPFIVCADHHPSKQLDAQDLRWQIAPAKQQLALF